MVASVLSVSGLMVLSPLSPASPARADVTAGDLVFAQDTLNGEGQETAIHIMRLSGSTETQLSNLPNDQAQFPDVSSDGSRIVFVDTQVTENDADECIGGGQGIWVMNSDGTDATQLTFPDCAASGSANFTDYNPMWSHDGTQIVFARSYYDSTYGNVTRIYSMNADGTNVQDLTPSDIDDEQPVWSPDGTKIAYDSIDGYGDRTVYVMDANGSNAHVVDPETDCSGGSYPQWTSTNTMFVLVGRNSACDWSMHLAEITSSDSFSDATGSTETDIGTFTAGSTAENLQMSADASTAYMDSGNGHVYSMDVASSSTSSDLMSDSEFNSEPSPVDATWPNASTKTIVALGDSVAAGEGIDYDWQWNGSGWALDGSNSPSWMDTTPAMGGNYQGCHESGLGYPNQLSLNGGNFQVYNMACTGASALNGILTGYTAGGDSVPAQLGWGGSSGDCPGCSSPSSQFNSLNPDIVTLTVGADDISFASWLEDCYFTEPDCNTSDNTTTIDGQISEAGTYLSRVLAELNRWAGTKSKTLQVYVTNYYNPYDTSDTSCIDVNNDNGFPGISVSGSGSDLTWIEDGLSSLNSEISTQVSSASGDSNLSVHLVDISNVMSGHQLCTSDPWVYGPSMDYPGGGDWGTNPAAIHPTPEGQQAIADAVNTAITG
jgi:hypothetical protein